MAHNKNKFIIYKDKILNIYNKKYSQIEYLLDRISSNHIFLLAAGLAFNILLYIIPLILITIYLISVFFKPDNLLTLINDTLVEFFPDTTYNQEIIYKIITEVQHIASGATTAGIIGFIALLWISSTVISTLNSCLSIIFNITQSSYIYNKLKDLGIIILITIFILGYSIFLPIFNFVKEYINTIFPDFLSGFFTNLIIILSPLVISFIVFYFIYGIVPYGAKNIPKKLILNTTIIAMILTEISRNIFTFYVSYLANYTRFYGTYAVLIIFAVWLYYSCFLLLFSAELSQFLWFKKHNIKLKNINPTKTINN